jgi:hypothetical protein
LLRAFPAQVSRPDIPRPASSGQTDTLGGTGDMALRNAHLEGEVKALGAEVRLLREAVERLERDPDRWHAQAERLALAPPQRRGWWPWRRAG